MTCLFYGVSLNENSTHTLHRDVFMSRIMTIRKVPSLAVRAYLFVFFLAVVPSLAQAQSTGRIGRPLRVAYLSTSATMASVWMAKEMGAVAKEGVIARR